MSNGHSNVEGKHLGIHVALQNSGDSDIEFDNTIDDATLYQCVALMKCSSYANVFSN